jgi:hypothetical protein
VVDSWGVRSLTPLPVGRRVAIEKATIQRLVQPYRIVEVPMSRNTLDSAFSRVTRCL